MKLISYTQYWYSTTEGMLIMYLQIRLKGNLIFLLILHAMGSNHFWIRFRISGDLKKMFCQRSKSVRILCQILGFVRIQLWIKKIFVPIRALIRRLCRPSFYKLPQAFIYSVDFFLKNWKWLPIFSISFVFISLRIFFVLTNLDKFDSNMYYQKETQHVVCVCTVFFVALCSMYLLM